MAWVPCVTEAPARRAAATSVASVISASVQPSFFACFAWKSMQYGHCVVMATAMAISSLYLAGIAPSFIVAASKAWNAAIASGASSFIVFIFFRFAMSYMESSIRDAASGSVSIEIADQPADVFGCVQQ